MLANKENRFLKLLFLFGFLPFFVFLWEGKKYFELHCPKLEGSTSEFSSCSILFYITGKRLRACLSFSAIWQKSKAILRHYSCSDFTVFSIYNSYELNITNLSDTFTSLYFLSLLMHCLETLLPHSALLTVEWGSPQETLLPSPISPALWVHF